MLKPVNRYILIEMPHKAQKSESLIVLPDDYKPKENKFIEVIALKAADDVRFKINKSARLVVDHSMMEEISVCGTIYNIILDNYVVGMIE